MTSNFFILTIYLALLFFEPQKFFPFLESIRFTYFVGIVGFIWIFTTTLLRTKILSMFDKRVYLFLLFVALCLVSLINVDDPFHKNTLFYELQKSTALFFMVFFAVRSDTDLKRLTLIIVCFMTFNCIGTIYFYVQGYISSYRMSSYFGSLGQSGSNEFALSIIQVIPLAFFFIHDFKIFKTKNAPVLFSILALLYCLTRTRSRTGFLAILIIFVTFLLIRRFSAKHIAVFALLLIVLFIKTPSSYFTRMGTLADSNTFEEDQNVVTRVESASVASEIIISHPITGVGLGKFIPYVEKNYHPLGFGRVFVVHNGFLLIAAECGIPALIIYLSFIFSTLINLRRSASATGSKSDLAYLADAYFCSILVFCFAVLFQPTIYSRLLYIIAPLSIKLIQNLQSLEATREG